jgi:hypothetical protein
LANADAYDVLADERTKAIRKGHSIKGKVPQSSFRSIEAAVKCLSYFDPNVEGPDLSAGKQIFQRARQSLTSGTVRRPGKSS